MAAPASAANAERPLVFSRIFIIDLNIPRAARALLRPLLAARLVLSLKRQRSLVELPGSPNASASATIICNWPEVWVEFFREIDARRDFDCLKSGCML